MASNSRLVFQETCGFDKSAYRGASSSDEDKTSQLLINFSDDVSGTNFDLDAFSRTNNIVAAIDPTFSKSKLGAKTLHDQDSNQDLLVNIDQVRSLNLSKSLFSRVCLSYAPIN